MSPVHAAAPDPFDDVIGRLSTDLGTLKVFVPLLDDALEITSDLEIVPPLIDGFTGAFDTFSAAVSTVAGLLDACDVIPGVDVVTGIVGSALTAIAGVMDTLSAGLTTVAGWATSLEAILPDLQAGLRIADDIVRFATIQLPDILNVLQIFDYLLDIAQPVVKMLTGSEAAHKLSKVIDTLETLRSAVEAAAKPFDEILKTFDKATTWIAHELADAGKKASKLLDKAKDGLHSALHVLHPIIGPFRKLAAVVNKIPHCVHDVVKFLEKAVDKVLKSTGLKHLVDGLENKLVDALGFGDVRTLLQAILQPDALSSHGGSANQNRGAAWKAAWDDLIAALGAYHTNKNEALKDLILALVSAIAGTPIDVNKPASIPDWPLPPRLHGVQTPSLARAPRRPHLSALHRATHASASVLHPTVQRRHTPVRVATAMREAVPPSPGWDGVDALLSAVEDANDAIEQVDAIAAKVRAQLHAFDAARTLPRSMQPAIDDVATILAFTSDLVGFVEGYTSLEPILDPVRQALNDQAVAAKALPGQAQDLVAAAAPLDEAVNAVLKAVPLDAAAHDAIDELDAWSAGALALVQLVQTGTSMDTDGTHASAIGAVRDAVNARSQELAAQAKQIAELVAQIGERATALDAALSTIGAAYLALGSHAQVISTKGLPTLQTVAHDLSLADSIFDPLSCLLEAFGCKAKAGSIKAQGAQLAAGFDRGTRAALAPVEANLRAGLDQLLGDTLPIAPVRSALNDANDTLRQRGPTVTSSCSDLVDKLHALAAAIAPVRSYQREIDGKTKTVHDPFMNTALADQVSAIILALQPQG